MLVVYTKEFPSAHLPEVGEVWTVMAYGKVCERWKVIHTTKTTFVARINQYFDPN